MEASMPQDWERKAMALFRYAQAGRSMCSVAHDVNNYLGAMLAYSELIGQDPQTPDGVKRMVGNVAESVRKCSALVNTVTSISREERPDREVVLPGPFVEQALDVRRHTFRAARVGLKTQMDGALPSLTVDRPQLTLAILYLATNALEAVAGLSEKSVVVSGALGADGTVELVFWNSGPEVGPDAREAMFEPFWTTKSGDHLGLGLTLARRIAKAHGGSLGYDAARGFVLRLPCA